MAEGFVYIFFNVSFPDLVKIGRTTGPVEHRASRLSTTGVPTPFIPVYDELVDDCEAVERSLHLRFRSQRVTERREFFRIPVREAIRALQAEAQARRPSNDVRDEQEILPQLSKAYGGRLAPDLSSVKIVTLTSVCYLEATRQIRGIVDEVVERTDLSFIQEGEFKPPYFQPENGAQANANRFLELTGYDLINCTNNLFTSDGANEIAAEHEGSDE